MVATRAQPLEYKFCLNVKNLLAASRHNALFDEYVGANQLACEANGTVVAHFGKPLPQQPNLAVVKACECDLGLRLHALPQAASH